MIHTGKSFRRRPEISVIQSGKPEQRSEAQQRIDSMPTATGADPVATALSGLGVVVGIANDQTRLSKDIANPETSTPRVSDWRDGGNAPMNTNSNLAKFQYERSQRTK